MMRLALALALLAFAATWPLASSAADVTVQYDVTGGQSFCNFTSQSGSGTCSFLGALDGSVTVQSGTITVNLQPAGSGGPPISTSQGSILVDLLMTNGASFVRTFPYALASTGTNYGQLTNFTRGTAKTLRAYAQRFATFAFGNLRDGFQAALNASSQGALMGPLYLYDGRTGTFLGYPVATQDRFGFLGITGVEVAVPEPEPVPGLSPLGFIGLAGGLLAGYQWFVVRR